MLDTRVRAPDLRLSGPRSVARDQVLRRADEGPAGERRAGGAVDTGVSERGQE